MTFVVQTKKAGLFCFDCGEFIPNTANNEMRKEGYFSYNHSCKENKEIREKLAKELNDKTRYYLLKISSSDIGKIPLNAMIDALSRDDYKTLEAFFNVLEGY